MEIEAAEDAPPLTRVLGAAAVAACLGVAGAATVSGAGAASPEPAPPPERPPPGTAEGLRAPTPEPQPDTLFLPRARTAPDLDCSVGEWAPEGRISLAAGEPEVLSARGAGGESDLTARLHLTWTRDTLYVMVDVRDDRVRPGTTGGGDWVRVELGTTTVWIPAPGGERTRANTGPRALGDDVPTSICAAAYGWLGEIAVPADRLGGDLMLGELIGLQVLAEDPDRAGEDAHPPYLRWSDAAVLAAAPTPQTRADSLLDRLREEVTMEELEARPGARDTTVQLPGGDTVSGLRVEIGGAEAVAFPDPRRGGSVTYWLEGGEGDAVDVLGLHSTIAALHRRLGQLQAAEDRGRPLFPEVRFELLPGVTFRLGEPASSLDELPRTAVPTDVFVRSGGGG